jgi:hypothetical protein
VLRVLIVKSIEPELFRIFLKPREKSYCESGAKNIEENSMKFWLWAVVSAKRLSSSVKEFPEVKIQLNSFNPFLASINYFITFTSIISHKETAIRGKVISTEGIIAGNETSISGDSDWKVNNVKEHVGTLK